MNYLANLFCSRQAVYGLVAGLILFVAAPSLAQETTQTNSAKTVRATAQIETAEETEIAPETVSEKSKTAEKTVSNKTLAAVLAEPESIDKSQLSDLTTTEKPITVQQSQQDDDTMEGVMGKRPAKTRIGGHVGFVLPLVARSSNSTALPIVDNFTIGFPVGLTVRTNSPVAFDFEFIPFINTPGRNNFFLTIHPGIIYGFKKKYAVGVRAAYDAGNDSYGFTPLISRGFKINKKLGWFIEGDFPIRWNRGATGDRFASGAFAVHFGLAF